MTTYQLPTEMLEKIFQHADLQTLKSCNQASKLFYDLTNKLISEKACANYPVAEIKPGTKPLRSYSKVRLEKHIHQSDVLALLDYYDPKGEIVKELEIRNASMSCLTLRCILRVWKSVHTLKLSNSDFEDVEVSNGEWIRTVKKLVMLDVDYVCSDFQGLEHIELHDESGMAKMNIASLLNRSAQTLQTLKISHGREVDFVTLSTMHRLESVEFDHFFIHGSVFEGVMRRFPYMKRLCLKDMDMLTFDTFSKVFTSSPDLRELKIIGCRNLSFNGYGDFTHARKLKKVVVESSHIKQQGLCTALSSPFMNLEELSINFLANRQKLDSFAIPTILRNAKTLQSLSLANCDMDATMFWKIARTLADLKHLALHDVGIESCSDNLEVFEELESLTITNPIKNLHEFLSAPELKEITAQLDNNHQILTKYPTLRKLQVSTRELSAEQLNCVIRELPQLEELTILHAKAETLRVDCPRAVKLVIADIPKPELQPQSVERIQDMSIPTQWDTPLREYW